jgi:hypothetical protein
MLVYDKGNVMITQMYCCWDINIGTILFADTSTLWEHGLHDLLSLLSLLDKQTNKKNHHYSQYDLFWLCSPADAYWYESPSFLSGRCPKNRRENHSSEIWKSILSDCNQNRKNNSHEKLNPHKQEELILFFFAPTYFWPCHTPCSGGGPRFFHFPICTIPCMWCSWLISRGYMCRN